MNTISFDCPVFIEPTSSHVASVGQCHNTVLSGFLSLLLSILEKLAVLKVGKGTASSTPSFALVEAAGLPP